VSRALAYCAFLEDPRISLPATGVGGAPVQMMAPGALRLLWSEVDWPFRPEHMQRHAVEFHSVIDHIFKQVAVVPFRLLSVLDDHGVLAQFAVDHARTFIADLERLRDTVQMECVVYPTPAPLQPNNSGAEYLRKKALLLSTSESFVKAALEAANSLVREARVRETKNGTRIFVLVKRGDESEFRRRMSDLPLPEHLSRRLSGPWPAAEFLSEEVKAPQVANAK
jgi:Gas vesicle synthesis protein GvpL/GvpF